MFAWAIWRWYSTSVVAVFKRTSFLQVECRTASGRCLSGLIRVASTFIVVIASQMHVCCLHLQFPHLCLDVHSETGWSPKQLKQSRFLSTISFFSDVLVTLWHSWDKWGLLHKALFFLGKLSRPLSLAIVTIPSWFCSYKKRGGRFWFLKHFACLKDTDLSVKGSSQLSSKVQLLSLCSLVMFRSISEDDFPSMIWTSKPP